MGLYGANGSAPVAVYAGSTPAQAVYLGSRHVWPDHAPELTSFTTAGSHQYTIPSWATKIDVIVLGGGGGGSAGSLFITGAGGYAPSWVTRTLVVGVDIPAGTTTLGAVVGAGGRSNTDGAESSVSGIGVTKIASAGGFKGGHTPAPPGQAVQAFGHAPGDCTFNGEVYAGGRAGSGGLGGEIKPTSPGGAGVGGAPNGPGGTGADGVVHFYAYQV